MTYSNVSSARLVRYWLASLFVFLVVSASAVLAEEWKAAGHLKYFLSQTDYDADNIFSQADTPTPTDQMLNLRLMAEKKWPSKWDAVLHYQVGAHHSDSIQAARGFGSLATLTGYGLPNDDARLFDLTSVISDEGKKLLFHRLDRASIGYTETNYVFRFGRKAISWGNGMVFQPMDIFNPFSPTAIDKEYKTGDDMLYLQNLLTNGDDIQTAQSITPTFVKSALEQDLIAGGTFDS